MSSQEVPVELLQELQRLGEALPDDILTPLNDALADHGRPPLGGPPRTKHIPELEKALEQPGNSDSKELIQRVLDNLHRQREIIEEIRRRKKP